MNLDIMDKTVQLGRKSNIELLRIVAMTMILVGHFIGHGIGLYPPQEENATYDILRHLVFPYCACGVNLFFMISGFFRIKTNTRSIFNFILTMLFWGIVNMVLLVLIGHEITIKNILFEIFFPISNSPYWFMQVYFLLMICAPLINVGIDNMALNDYRKFMVIFTVVTVYSCGIGHNIANTNGATFLQAVYMYCLAALIRRDNAIFVKFKAGYYLIAYFIIVSIGAIGLYTTHILSFTSYNSVINILAATALFLFFCKLQFHNKIINSISTATLGCYLLQDGLFGIYYLYGWCHQIYLDNFISIVAMYFLLLFLSIWCISWVLSKICKNLSNALYTRIFNNFSFIK